MISHIIFGLAILILLLLLRLAFKTARIYFIYKRRYGNQVKFLFYPFLGLHYFMQSSLKTHDDGYHFLKEIVQKNPNVKAIIVLSGFMDFFIANDNDWIKYLSQDQRQFYKDDAFFAYDILFGESLIFCKYGKWKRERAFLNTNFHFESLKQRIPVLKDEVKNLCKGLKSGEDFVTVNPFDELKLVTSEFITRTFFGHPFKDIKCKNGKPLTLETCSVAEDCYTLRISSLHFIIKAAILGCSKASRVLLSPPEKKLLARIREVYEIIENQIDIKLEEMQKIEDIQSYKPTNYIEMQLKEYLLQQKIAASLSPDELMSKKEIVQQYLGFYFAGTDTTTQLTSMCLFEMSRNPHIKERLLKEIRDSGKTFEEMEPNDLQKLPYLDAIIKESTRLYTAIAFLFPRKIDTNYQREDLFIHKDLLVTNRLTQYSEEKEFFADSDKFIPERYLNQQNVQKLSPFDLIPFSSGERVCIGQHMGIMQAKFLLIYMISNFEIAPVPNYKLKMFQQMVNAPLDCDMIKLKRK